MTGNGRNSPFLERFFEERLSERRDIGTGSGRARPGRHHRMSAAILYDDSRVARETGPVLWPAKEPSNTLRCNYHALFQYLYIALFCCQKSLSVSLSLSLSVASSYPPFSLSLSLAKTLYSTALMFFHTQWLFRA